MGKKERKDRQRKERERSFDLDRSMEPRRRSIPVDEKDLHEVPLTEEKDVQGTKRKTSLFSGKSAAQIFAGKRGSASSKPRNNSAVSNPGSRRSSGSTVSRRGEVSPLSGSSPSRSAHSRRSISPAPMEDSQVDIIPKAFSHRTEGELLRMKKKIKRKLDWRIIPFLTIMGFLNMLCVLSLEKVKVLNKGFQWGIKVEGWRNAEIIATFISIAWTAPSVMILSRVSNPHLYLGFWLMATGIMTSCVVLITNHLGAGIILVLHAVAAAVFFPGAVLYCSSWYTRRELPLRLAIISLGPTLAYAFAGVIAVRCAEDLRNMPGVDGSKWFLGLVGVLSIIVGMMAGMGLPRWPRNTEWLSEEQREYTIHYIAQDGNGNIDGDEHQSGWKSFWKAFADGKLYLLCLISLFISFSGQVSSLFPNVVNQFGFRSRQYLLLMTVPPYIVAWVVALLLAISTGRTDNRWCHISLGMIIALIGHIIYFASGERVACYVALFFMVAGTKSAFIAFLAWVGTTIPRPRAKRATAIGITWALPALVVALMSVFWKKKDLLDLRDGRSVTAHMITLIVVAVLAILVTASLRLWLGRCNKKFARHEGLDDDKEAYRGRDGRNIKNGGKIGFRYPL